MSAIRADVTQECSELGDVTVVEMPRVGEHGAGNAYAVFKERVDAERAKRALHGRKFAGRVVTCCFSGEAETEPEVGGDAAAAAPAPAPSLESSRWADDPEDAPAEGAGAVPVADTAAEGDAAAQSSCKRAADDDAGDGSDAGAAKVARVAE